jgi:DNA repair exonuclease SbcCD ATPase subunit
MNIEITGLTLTAFRSINRPIIVEFNEIPNGLVFVSGNNLVEPELESNGAGKSTIMEGICWVLFAKTSMNLRAGVIHNWVSKRNTKGTIIVKRDNVVHTIERGWDPNYLKLDKEIVSQERLEQFLDIDFYSFLYSVFISQRGSKFFDLESSMKLKVFTSILKSSLDKWIRASDRASELTKKYSVSMIKLREEIARVSGAISSIDIEALREKYDVFEDRRKSDIRIIKSRIKEKRLKVDTLEIKTNDTSGKTKIISDRLESTKSTFKVLKEERDAIERQINVLSEEIAVNKSKMSDIRVEISTMKDLKGKSICPTCGGIISVGRLNGHLTHMSNMLEGKVEERMAAMAVKKSLHDDLDKRDVDLEAIVTNIDILTNKHNEFLSDGKNNLRELSSIELEISTLEGDLDTRSDLPNPFEELIEEEIKKERNFRKQRREFKKELEEVGSSCSVTELWKKGFKEIRLVILDESLKELEIQINNNLPLLGLQDWRIELNIESETKRGTIVRELSVLVISPSGGGKVPLEVWSGGEGQRLILAGTLGLMDFISNKKGTEWNIEWLDEPSQFLSPSGIESLLDILYIRAKKLDKTIFFADQRHLETEGKFSAIMNVVKSGRGTKVESITM